MAVDERLRDKLHDQLFHAILELRSLDECYEFLRIFVLSRKCVPFRHAWK